MKGERERVEEIQERGLFQGITQEQGVKEKIKQVLSMLPSGHRNLGEEKTSGRMSRGMTASLDLVLISNTYFVCVCVCVCVREEYKHL